MPLLQQTDKPLSGILAALGAGWALGLSPEMLRAGIETYRQATAAVAA